MFYNIAYGVTDFKFRATFRYLFSERLVDYLMKNEDYNQWYPFRILSDFLDNFDKYREDNSERISKLILIRTYELDSLYCAQSITDQWKQDYNQAINGIPEYRNIVYGQNKSRLMVPPSQTYEFFICQLLDNFDEYYSIHIDEHQ